MQAPEIMTPSQLSCLLKQYTPLLYMPNVGNLGDLLIAEGTRQFFKRNNIEYREFDRDQLPERYNLVYAGGARFTSCWCDEKEAILSLTDPRIQHCIILPQSIYQVDSLLEHLDKRHTIICREERSFYYCVNKCKTSRVLLADDLALQLRLDECEPEELEPPSNEEERKTLRRIENGLLKRLSFYTKQASFLGKVNGATKRVAFLMRRDRERVSRLNHPMNYDITAQWHTSGRAMAYNSLILHAFKSALCQADIIVSDRLHVCIMAFLCGLEVYMIDNAYNKLSGVYKLSLKNNPNVHLICGEELPEDLSIIWRQSQKPLRILRYNLISRAFKLGLKFTQLRAALKRLRSSSSRRHAQ